MDEQAFIQQIFDHPDEEDTALIYADWLEEHGQTDRARLIRAEIEYEMDTRGDNNDRFQEVFQLTRELPHVCSKALPIPASLRKKVSFNFHRGLASVSVAPDADLTTADLRALSAIPFLKTLDNFERLPPDRVAQLTLCPNIQGLTLTGWRSRALTEADWQAITPLKQIERLELRSEHITDEDVRQLSVMRQLKGLDLSTAAVSDAGVAHLEGLDNLDTLRFEEALITDAAMEVISSFRRLRELSLTRCAGITEASLPHLSKLKNLTRLDLGNTSINGDPVPVLIQLKDLRFVGLKRIRGVNDTNIKDLAKRLRALRELDLRLTSVTRFRLARLLPKTKWKKVRMETSLNAVDTPEEAEIKAFREHCRELDVCVEVDME